MWQHWLLSTAFLLWHSAVGVASGGESLPQPQGGGERCLIQLSAAHKPVGFKADEDLRPDANSGDLQGGVRPEASLSPRWPNPILDFGEAIYSSVFRPAFDEKAHGKVPSSSRTEADRDTFIRDAPNIAAKTKPAGHKKYGSLRPEVAGEPPMLAASSRRRRSLPKRADKEVSFDPIPTPMLETGVGKIRGLSTNKDDDTFFIPVPRPDDPMLVSGSRSFGSSSMQPGQEAVPDDPMLVSGSRSFGGLSMQLGEAAGFNPVLGPTSAIAAGFEELGGLAKTDKDVFDSWVPSPAARLVSVDSKVPARTLVQMDEQEQFFNPVPSPVAPMLPEDARAIFGSEAPLLSNTVHSQIWTEDIFRDLEEEALPAKGPSLFANTMRMKETQKRDRHTSHVNVGIQPLQELVEPQGAELLGSSPAEAVERLRKTPLQPQTDSESLLERVWGHVAGAAQRTRSKFLSLVYMVPVPGLFFLVAAAVTSGVALLTVGRIKHQDEVANSRDPRNPRIVDKDFGSLFTRLTPRPPVPERRHPQEEEHPNIGPQDLDPSSPFAEALADGALPPVQQSRSGSSGSGSGSYSVTGPSNNDGTLSKLRRNLLKGVPMQPIFWKSFGKSPTSSYEVGTPHGQALTAGHYLCPGLVVPPDCECIFAVPTIKGFSSEKYVVFDLAGQPALQLEVRMPDWVGSSGLDPKPVVVLNTCERREEDGKVIASKALAYCKMEYHAGSQNDQDHQQDKAYIYDAGGVLFGTLSAWAVQNQCYTLTGTRSSIKLSLEGNFDEHMVNIWSESRHIVGDSSPSCNSSFDQARDYWRLRVLANMDAGLLLTSLVCAELIEGKNRHRRTLP